MSDPNHKKQDDHQGGINPGVAAVAGAVVGAGVAVAATLALENPDNREKVKEVFTNAKDKVADYIEDAKERAQEKVEEVQEKLDGDK